MPVTVKKSEKEVNNWQAKEEAVRNDDSHARAAVGTIGPVTYYFLKGHSKSLGQKSTYLADAVTNCCI